MPFNLQFPAQNPDMSALELDVGEMMFVLGANGTGKSSLMFYIARNNLPHMRKIAAHRQTWMRTDTLDMTPAKKIQTEQSIQSVDGHESSRYKDDYAAQRASMTIYDLIDAENMRAREIASFVDEGDLNAATNAAKEEAPITVINELLSQSNIPVSISLRANERLVAKKDGGPEYSAAQLSDGERNALLIAGDVLTAPKGALLIIDEPERHLHRSIISPLLKRLFEKRLDCGFVISTHDHDLPLQIPKARILLLRSCRFNGAMVRNWEVDELSSAVPIDDITKRDLLGNRRTILFIEGSEQSLDKQLYSIVFPNVSIVPKGSCRDVENAVRGARGAQTFHWLRTYGIVDGDGYSEEQVKRKREEGIFALSVYSVEAIYFNPKIIKRLAQKQSDVIGDDADTMFDKAIRGAISAVSNDTERLSKKAVKKSVRKMILDQIPNDDCLLEGNNLSLSNDSIAMLNKRKAELDAAVVSNDWGTFLTKASVRESGALTAITRALRFQHIQDLEKAVRHLLSTDEETLTFVRELFEDLSSELQS